MIEVILTNNYFSFDHKHYKQISGTPMGSCISPSVADLVLDVLIDETMKKIHFEVPFIKKYVDDLITIVPENEINTILDVFNSYNEAIQFTIEVEKNRRLPFLDMLIEHHPNGTLTTCWYRKPTSSGRILNYYSNHPMQQKISTAIGLIDRVTRLTNDPTVNTRQIIQNSLERNGFPSKLVFRLVKSRTQLSVSDTTISARNNRVQSNISFYRSLIYIRSLSDKVKKTLRICYPEVAISLVPNNNINWLFTRLKDKRDKLSQSCVVYSIPCSSCEKCYVGQTIQHLRKRVSNHLTQHRKHQELLEELDEASSNLDDVVTNLECLAKKTTLIQHSIFTGHLFEYRNVSILGKETNRQKLNFLEMLYISQKDCVNSRSDIQGLSILYKGLIDQHQENGPQNRNVT